MTVNTLLNNVVSFILQPIVVLMFAVALVVFFWGIVQFISNSSSEDGRAQGKKNIFWGIVGMFIMIAVYGIIRLILGTFFLPVPPYLGI